MFLESRSIYSYKGKSYLYKGREGVGRGVYLAITCDTCLLSSGGKGGREEELHEKGEGGKAKGKKEKRRREGGRDVGRKGM